MSIFIILLLVICWIICLVISVAIYPRLIYPLWKKIGITVLLSFTLPIVIIIGLVGDFFKKKKPIPVNKDLLSLLKYNTVKDGNKYITLSEYNELHGTSYTLADVYGKEYAEKHSFEEDDCGTKSKVPETEELPF